MPRRPFLLLLAQKKEARKGRFLWNKKETGITDRKYGKVWGTPSSTFFLLVLLYGWWIHFIGHLKSSSRCDFKSHLLDPKKKANNHKRLLTTIIYGYWQGDTPASQVLFSECVGCLFRPQQPYNSLFLCIINYTLCLQNCQCHMAIY